jgi:hypothetical protein
VDPFGEVLIDPNHRFERISSAPTKQSTISPLDAHQEYRRFNVPDAKRIVLRRWRRYLSTFQTGRRGECPRTPPVSTSAQMSPSTEFNSNGFPARCPARHRHVGPGPLAADQRLDEHRLHLRDGSEELRTRRDLDRPDSVAEATDAILSAHTQLSAASGCSIHRRRSNRLRKPDLQVNSAPGSSAGDERPRRKKVTEDDKTVTYKKLNERS